MKLATQLAFLVTLLFATVPANGSRALRAAEPLVAPTATPTTTQATLVYEYGKRLVPASGSALPPPTTSGQAALPARSAALSSPLSAYAMSLTTNNTNSRVVHFDEATCVSLESCQLGKVVVATWFQDLGSPTDNVVTFFSDAACSSPITTALPAPSTVDFRKQGDFESPRSFAVGMWFIDFDYPSHLVEACATVSDGSPIEPTGAPTPLRRVL